MILLKHFSCNRSEKINKILALVVVAAVNLKCTIKNGGAYGEVAVIFVVSGTTKNDGSP